jgi:hypothetical protein
MIKNFLFFWPRKRLQRNRRKERYEEIQIWQHPDTILPGRAHMTGCVCKSDKGCVWVVKATKGGCSDYVDSKGPFKWNSPIFLAMSVIR